MIAALLVPITLFAVVTHEWAATLVIGSLFVALILGFALRPAGTGSVVSRTLTPWVFAIATAVILIVIIAAALSR